MPFITKTIGYFPRDYRKMCDAMDTAFTLAHQQSFKGADAETVSGLVKVFLAVFATQSDVEELGRELGCGRDHQSISYAVQDHIVELLTIDTKPLTLAQYLADRLGLPDPQGKDIRDAT